MADSRPITPEGDSNVTLAGGWGLNRFLRLGKGDYGVMQTGWQSQSRVAPWDDTHAHDAYMLRQGETHATPHIPSDIAVVGLAAKHGRGYGDRSEADLRPAARRHHIRLLG